MAGKIIGIDFYDEAFSRAKEAVASGKLVVYPTDTLYGLGCDATNAKAVVKLLELKGGRDKPVSIVVSDLEMLKKYCELDGEQAGQITSLLPGPFTIVLKKKKSSKLAEGVSSTETVGVRVPEHVFVKRLVRELGVPITSTSANTSGKPAPTQVSELEKTMVDGVSVIIDCGKTAQGTASTVIDFSGGKPKVLRTGAGIERIPIEWI
ncbi:threonylcarbamoyl-AMP synthase [Candidatus Micrarchaeota archaeon]|nr:threonylcarbamoyl-AMP synthase [Candidatus Micrarchaeota archaeon]